MPSDGAASRLNHPARWVILLLLAVLLPLGSTASAAEAGARAFHLPPGDAADTLKQFAVQAQREIMFPAEPVVGVRTNPVEGMLTPRDALERLVAKTGLVIVEDPKTGALMVTRPATTVARITEPSPESPQSSEKSPSNMKRRTPLAIVSGWLALVLLPAPGARAADGSPLAVGTIEGRVYNVANGAYFNNARVSLEGTEREVQTNSFGEFRFEHVPVGPAKVRVIVSGFFPQTASTIVAATAPAVVNVGLSFTEKENPGAENAVVLDRFVVESKREITGSAIALNERRTASNLVHVIAADEFGDSPEGNAAELLKLMSGVAVGYIGSDPRTVSIRGLPSYGTPVLFDGAPMATSTGGRETEFSQVSLNNAARVEVIKSPTPDTRADSIGGTINIVSRNAFERSRAVFNYRANLSTNRSRWDSGNSLSLGRTPGGPQGDSHKMFPGFDLDYLQPLSRNLGFTLSAVSSGQFTPDTVLSSTWSPTQSGTSLAPTDRPFLRSFGMQYGLRQMFRRSVGGTVDWRATSRDVFNLAVQYNWQRTPVAQDLQTFGVIGSRADVASYDPTFVQSGLGAGSITHALSMFDRIANSYNLQLKHRRTGTVWTFEEAVSFSESWSGDFVWRAGMLKTLNLSATNVTLGLQGIQDSIPRSITTRTSANATFGWEPLGNYRLTSATVVPPGLTRNATASARISAARDYSGENSLRIKVGAEWRRLSRDAEGRTLTYTFVGPDRVANTADDLASRYDLVADSWSQVRLPFGLGQPQKPAPAKGYGLLRDHPEYWTLNEATAISSQASNSQKLNENVVAGFIRADLSLLRNRLKLVGGVRYEATFNEGWGVLNDLSKTYQKDAAGRIIRAPNGTPVRVTSDPAALARLQYTSRGSYAKSDYGDFYPSANVTYLFSEHLMGRASFARTITRPQLSDIIPSITATDPTSTAATPTLTVTNLGLRPWYSNSFDVALEYYFEKPGMLSIGLFRKDISDFFASVRLPVTPAQLAEWGFDESFSNYDVVTKQNVGSARVTGVEYEYRHTLPWFPDRWGNLLVNFNATTLQVDGVAASTLSGFLPLTMNYGFTYSTARLTARANWNHLGRTPQGLIAGITGANVEPDTRNHRAPRTSLDVNFEFRLTRRFALFANLRNLTDVPWRFDAYGASTPAYARGTRWVQYGTNAMAGVKGSF